MLSSNNSFLSLVNFSALWRGHCMHWSSVSWWFFPTCKIRFSRIYLFLNSYFWLSLVSYIYRWRHFSWLRRLLYSSHYNIMNELVLWLFRLQTFSQSYRISHWFSRMINSNLLRRISLFWILNSRDYFLGQNVKLLEIASLMSWNHSLQSWVLSNSSGF